MSLGLWEHFFSWPAVSSSAGAVTVTVGGQELISVGYSGQTVVVTVQL